jgi:energy-coupling factor transporter ATP-binding protein EcfA2
MFVVAIVIIVCLNALVLLLLQLHIHDVVVVSSIRIVHQPPLPWQQSFLFRSTSAGTTTTTTSTNSTNPTHLNHYKNRNSYYVTAAFASLPSFVPQSPVSSTGWTTKHRFNNGGATSTSTTPFVDGQRTRTAIAGTLPIRYIPSQIQWNNVSQSYPKKSVFHQMLSSVPYRPWALQNISLMVTHNNNNNNNSNTNHSPPQWNTTSRWWVVGPYVLLTGMSSSGKSTLLQTIIHATAPTTCGTVTIGCSGAYGTTTTLLEPKLWAATPILLVDGGGGGGVLSSSVYNKTSSSSSWMTIQQLRHEHDRTIGSILQQDIQSIIRNTNHTSDHRITTQVLHDLLFCCNFNVATITTTTTPAQLIPSEQYKLVLVRAAFYSIFGGANRTNHENHSDEGTECSVFLPGPILLLDEYLDRETSTIVQPIQTALTSMCDYMGAICIVSTHYPQRFDTTTIQQQQQQLRSSSSFANRTTSTTHRFVQPHPIITLCRGEILHVV